MRLYLILSLFLCYLFVLPATAAAEQRILVLQSYHPGFVWSDRINQGILDTIPHNIIVQIEYMDTKRLNTPAHFANLKQFWKQKFQGFQYDAVITVDDEALLFAKTYRQSLFPDAPIVFCGVNNILPESHLPADNVTGIMESVDIAGTVAVAQKLQPQAKELLVVSDQSLFGQQARQMLEQSSDIRNSRLTITYLHDLSLPDILTRIAAASTDSMVLNLPFHRDAAGKQYQSDEVTARVSAASNAPVYTLWEHDMGHGVVGGHVLSAYNQGQTAATMALQILQGARASDLPIITDPPRTYLFDYRQLQRFRFDASALPPESEFLHKPLSFYEQYQSLVLSTFLVFALLILAVLTLWHLNVSRRRELEAVHKLALVVESSDDAIISRNQQGIITSWNSGAMQLFGYTAEEAIGQSIRIIVPDELLEDWNKSVAQLEQGIKEEHNKGLRRHKDGHLLMVLKTASPLYSPEGYPMGASIIYKDISQLETAYEEIRTLNSELEDRVAKRTAALEAANQELEAFSYSVSHDLRSPLRSIDGFSLALLEDYSEHLDDTGRDYLQRLRGASQRMGQLIDDMLHLARISRTQMNLEKVNLSELAFQVLTELQQQEPQRQVEIRIEPSLMVLGDMPLLRIVLDNLLGNAWKFTGKTTQPSIEFGCRQDQETGELAFFVRDNGAGFDMAYAHKLFGVFQRLHHAKEFSGTGIGLATVNRIIHRHGGRIWADSQVNQGATFFFTIDTESK
ncbi:MAG: PAS domain S-box protein [Negativicutes bacterium]|nr:PAS domain S-box protein [Negativicutes bacterium]